MITDAEKLQRIKVAYNDHQDKVAEAAKALAAKDAPEDLQTHAIVRAIEAQQELNAVLDWAFK